MVACLPGARLFIARYVCALRTTGSKFSKSLSRSGNCMHPTEGDETDEGGNKAPIRSCPSHKCPANHARPSSPSQSAREDGESQVELVIMSMDDDRKDEHISHHVTV